MKRELERMASRARGAGAADGQVSFINGDEHVEEMRRLVIAATHKCPLLRADSGCPFRIMSGLGHQTLERLAHSLSRDQCLYLFEMEMARRSATFGNTE